MQKIAVLVLTPLLVAFAGTADTPPGLSDAQFDHALRNISTAPNYVLVTVRDLSTGSNQPVCVEAEFLVSALITEHGLKLDQVVPFALTQPDRTFSFTNAAALDSLKPAYSSSMLEEARAFLSKFTVPQVVAATRDQESKFYEFCAREPGAYSARFPALAHVLSEKGILCTRGCKPGIFEVETNRIRLAPATAPLKEELTPVLFSRMEKKEAVELKLLTEALVGTQLTLRAYAATTLGDSGNPQAIPFLIDALYDDSMHVGAHYSDPGDHTTRHRANKALKKLTNQDFGYVWDDPPPKREAAIAKWTRWYLIEVKPKSTPK